MFCLAPSLAEPSYRGNMKNAVQYDSSLSMRFVTEAGIFKIELNAVEVFVMLNAVSSAFHSDSVGNRYPLGQGLLVPLTPCHKLAF